MQVTFVSFDVDHFPTILQSVIKMNAENSRPTIDLSFKSQLLKTTPKGLSYHFNHTHGPSIVAEGDYNETFKNLALRVIDLSYELKSDAHLFYKNTRIGVTKEQSAEAINVIGGRSDLINDMLAVYYDGNPAELADVMPGERILLQHRRKVQNQAGALKQ